MKANEFIKWLNQFKVASVPNTDGLQNIYIIWQGNIQAMVESKGEYLEETIREEVIKESK